MKLAILLILLFVVYLLSSTDGNRKKSKTRRKGQLKLGNGKGKKRMFGRENENKQIRKQGNVSRKKKKVNGRKNKNGRIKKKTEKVTAKKKKRRNGKNRNDLSGIKKDGPSKRMNNRGKNKLKKTLNRNKKNGSAKNRNKSRKYKNQKKKNKNTNKNKNKMKHNKNFKNKASKNSKKNKNKWRNKLGRRNELVEGSQGGPHSWTGYRNEELNGQKGTHYTSSVDKSPQGTRQTNYIPEDKNCNTPIVQTQIEIDNAVVSYFQRSTALLHLTPELNQTDLTVFKYFFGGTIELCQISSKRGSSGELVGSVISQNITRCYHQNRKCIARRDGACLSSLFDGSVLDILMTKETSSDDFRCANWTDTRYRGQPGKANRCIHPIGTAPWCHAQSGTKQCFDACNIAVNNTYVGPGRPKINLPLNFGRSVNMEWQKTDDSILVKAWAEQKNDETIIRCYDKSKQCIAKKGGPCLRDLFSDDILIVLSNKVDTKSGIVCDNWDKSEYSLAYSNLCSNPADHPDGPWCFTSTTQQKSASCFPPCDEDTEPKSFNVDDLLTNTKSIETRQEIEDSIVGYKRPLITLKLTKTDPSLSSYAVFKSLPFGLIRLYQFTTKHSSTGGPDLLASFNVQNISRCFNTIDYCVARSDGICLETLFSGPILTILKNKDDSKGGIDCDNWSSTDYIKRSDSKCIYPTGFNNDGPWCHAFQESRRCFMDCNIDINSTAVGPDQTTLTITLNYDQRLTVQWQQDWSLFVRAWHGYNHDIILRRCYDKVKQCVAWKDGPCLYNIFSGDFLTVLTNRDYTQNEKKCKKWDRKVYKTSYGNVCSNPTKNPNGPWCYTESSQMGSCFEICDQGDPIKDASASSIPLSCDQHSLTTTYCSLIEKLDGCVRVGHRSKNCPISISRKYCIPENKPTQAPPQRTTTQPLPPDCDISEIKKTPCRFYDLNSLNEGLASSSCPKATIAANCYGAWAVASYPAYMVDPIFGGY